ncbi:uncharacterized protein Hap1MRO34_011630 [Clarias gariepinus]|uniref:uncharacterized protein LOC128529653 n=1 Tax=Clarias gariepinus TaxID=13013 RepID=UPI00234DBAA0|nr:uncharacterized protein LOC128529653 [Clarias gariepinus]
MTDRDKWILENLGHIQNFMKRVASGPVRLVVGPLMSQFLHLPMTVTRRMEILKLGLAQSRKGPLIRRQPLSSVHHRPVQLLLVNRQRQLGPPRAPWTYQPTLGPLWAYQLAASSSFQPAASMTFQAPAGPPPSFQLPVEPSSLQRPASSPRQLSTPVTSSDAGASLICQAFLQAITPVQTSTPSTPDDTSFTTQLIRALGHDENSGDDK